MGTRRVCYGQVCGLVRQGPGQWGAGRGEGAASASLGLTWGRWEAPWLHEGGSAPSHPVLRTLLPLVPAPLLICLFLQEEAVGPWYHPSAQQLQPLFGERRLTEGGRGWVKTLCCLADAWNGGSSLLIRGVLPPEAGNVAVRWVHGRGRRGCPRFCRHS